MVELATVKNHPFDLIFCQFKRLACSGNNFEAVEPGEIHTRDIFGASKRAPR